MFHCGWNNAILKGGDRALIHLQCLLGQLVALWWLIYFCNAETNEIFAFHHPIWMNQNKAHWAEPQRHALCCHYSYPPPPPPLSSVFNAWALEASPCVMTPSGNRFRLHSPSMFFEVLQVKGTRATLTTWHCFDCLTKKRVRFNFSLVSGVIKQAVWWTQTPCAKNWEIVLERKLHSEAKPGCQASSPFLTKQCFATPAASRRCVFKSRMTRNGP